MVTIAKWILSYHMNYIVAGVESLCRVINTLFIFYVTVDGGVEFYRNQSKFVGICLLLEKVWKDSAKADISLQPTQIISIIIESAYWFLLLLFK